MIVNSLYTKYNCFTITIAVLCVKYAIISPLLTTHLMNITTLSSHVKHNVFYNVSKTCKCPWNVSQPNSRKRGNTHIVTERENLTQSQIKQPHLKSGRLPPAFIEQPEQVIWISVTTWLLLPCTDRWKCNMFNSFKDEA